MQCRQNQCQSFAEKCAELFISKNSKIYLKTLIFQKQLPQGNGASSEWARVDKLGRIQLGVLLFTKKGLHAKTGEAQNA